MQPVYDAYVSRHMETPEYRRTKISLDRLARSVVRIGGSWQNTSRDQALRELDQVLASLHELESQAEVIEDAFIRGHVLDRHDAIAAMRRSIVEEIRWDLLSNGGNAQH